MKKRGGVTSKQMGIKIFEIRIWIAVVGYE
jgi:hypothetical protein